MTNAPTIEAELLGQCVRFYLDPLGWVRWAFDWGHGELAGETIDGWQREFLTELGRQLQQRHTGEAKTAIRMAVASGHGIGKTTLVAWLILWAMSTRPNLAGVATANTRNQLADKTWRELAIWKERCLTGHWFERPATSIHAKDSPDTWVMNAVAWRAEKPEAFAGLHAEHVLVVYDEASAIPDVIWEVTEGAMTTAGAIWLAFGNPTRNTGRFRECWGKWRDRWITKQVDARTARKANRAELDQWIRDYGEDSDFARIRILGQFPRTASTQLIAQDIVEAAQARLLEADRGAPLIQAVDVARFGDDASVIAWRQGRDAKTIPWTRLVGKDLEAVTGAVIEGINRYKPEITVVDGNGVGAGVVDRLKALRYRVLEVNFGERAEDQRRFANKRAECWWRMAEWLQTGSIPSDDTLRDDMIGPEYGYDGTGRLVLERKEDMKRRGLASPDAGDALAMTFAKSVARRDVKPEWRRPTHAVAGYDLLA